MIKLRPGLALKELIIYRLCFSLSHTQILRGKRRLPIYLLNVAYSGRFESYKAYLLDLSMMFVLCYKLGVGIWMLELELDYGSEATRVIFSVCHERLWMKAMIWLKCWSVKYSLDNEKVPKTQKILTLSATSSSSIVPWGRDSAFSCRMWTASSILVWLILGSTMNSNSSLVLRVAMPALLKNALTCCESSLRKSRARGWSRSTAWLTSMRNNSPCKLEMILA